MLQISSGILKGIQLQSPPGDSTRPTSGRLRQALFNVLRSISAKSGPRSYRGDLFEGATVVDLFAGTGALGLEAASNGATHVVFVENNQKSFRVLERNVEWATGCLQKQGLEAPRVDIFFSDVFQTYEKLPACRLVFADPPYREEGLLKLFDLEAEHSKIETGGVFVIETSSKTKVETADRHPFRLAESKIYGDSAVHFFVKT